MYAAVVSISENNTQNKFKAVLTEEKPHVHNDELLNFRNLE